MLNNTNDIEMKKLMMYTNKNRRKNSCKNIYHKYVDKRVLIKY